MPQLMAGISSQPSYTVAMTGYNAVPEQTDADPTVTASGAYSNPDIVAARSVDLADELPFGTVIEIVPREATSTGGCGIALLKNDIGLRVIADSMHSRKRNQVDLLFDTDPSVSVGGKKTNPAVTLGVCKDVEVRVVGRVDVAKMPRNQAELKKVVGAQLLALSK